MPEFFSSLVFGIGFLRLWSLVALFLLYAVLSAQERQLLFYILDEQ
jgi:hypothetical protein